MYSVALQFPTKEIFFDLSFSMLENHKTPCVYFCFFVLFDCCNIIIFYLKRLRVAFSSLCVEKQAVSLIFNLFSSPLNPLKRFRVAFSLLCVKKTIFYSSCPLRVAFSFAFLCAEKQGVSLVFNMFSSLLTPLKRFRVAFSLLCVKKTFFILVVCCVWLSASCV